MIFRRVSELLAQGVACMTSEGTDSTAEEWNERLAGMYREALEDLDRFAAHEERLERIERKLDHVTHQLKEISMGIDALNQIIDDVASIEQGLVSSVDALEALVASGGDLSPEIAKLKTLADGVTALKASVDAVVNPAPAPPPAAPTITGVSPTSGVAGNQPVITGTGFAGATSVKFGGVDAGFNVDSDSQITATVPGAGDGSGSLEVDTPAGSAAGSYTVTG